MAKNQQIHTTYNHHLLNLLQHSCNQTLQDIFNSNNKIYRFLSTNEQDCKIFGFLRIPKIPKPTFPSSVETVLQYTNQLHQLTLKPEIQQTESGPLLANLLGNHLKTLKSIRMAANTKSSSKMLRKGGAH